MASADKQSVGIIGAGQMGLGIAHVCALAGFDVIMSDISEDQLKTAMQTAKTMFSKTLDILR